MNPPFTNIKQLFVEVKINQKQKICLVFCYIPPDSSSSIFINFIASLEWLLVTLPANYKIIVMGDFNLPNKYFVSHSDGLRLNGVHSESAEVLCDFFSKNGFLLYSQIFNNNNFQLYLVFSNYNNTIVTSCSD